MSIIAGAAALEGDSNLALPGPLRFRSRHVHKTVADYLESGLDDLGWVTAPVNFGTPAVTFSEFEPDEPNPTEIKVNTVSITMGDELPDEELELGGRLLSTKWVLFVDVYGANRSVANSICSDVKTLLADLYLPVLDFTASNEGYATNERLTVDRDTILVERPAEAADVKDIRKNWRVVKATIEVTFQE